ncbi:hypothetical protein Pcinc_001263 [Petrolisthes cinctipes]|uniref:Uncharacterized protein n=1 Tax=Petrolisthes cinctipes TaxID=88211 RepID=A0AAE1L622_PETCI|nr:hypothetical protein Pcinc_001263 [Petrolisthes cinctipes]
MSQPVTCVGTFTPGVPPHSRKRCVAAVLADSAPTLQCLQERTPAIMHALSSPKLEPPLGARIGGGRPPRIPSHRIPGALGGTQFRHGSLTSLHISLYSSQSCQHCLCGTSRHILSVGYSSWRSPTRMHTKHCTPPVTLTVLPIDSDSASCSTPCQVSHS